MADVARRVREEDGPVLLLGDLNMTDQSPAYRFLAAELQDAHRQAGWGFGFTYPYRLRLGGLPVPGPVVRIDYILFSEHYCATWTRVACGGGSDHCYLVAELHRSAPKP
jgi:endonuclease/exonuclease/phosphatase family metal-dependent hydrolase